MRNRPRSSGFTLVELMVVVAIICVIGAVAARMYSGGVRGETVPAFARTMLGTVLDARHMAVSLGKPVRLRFLTDASTGSSYLETDSYEYQTSTSKWSWTTQTMLKVPSAVQLCAPAASNTIGSNGNTATCPSTFAATTMNAICFSTNGRVDVPSDGNCPTASGSTTMTGATIYMETYKADKKYRVAVWGLTGLAKVLDSW